MDDQRTDRESGRIIEPTDPQYEADKGRVALWLDAEDVKWLAQHCDCTDATPAEERERCGRIRFRANAALHKSGKK